MEFIDSQLTLLIFVSLWLFVVDSITSQYVIRCEFSGSWLFLVVIVLLTEQLSSAAT